MEFTIEELLDIQQYGESVSDSLLVEGLIELANREKALLEAMGDDKELRAITVHNYTVLATAAAKILTDQENKKPDQES